MQGLVDLAPPGVDELMAMSDVIASLDLTNAKGAYDVIVVDTAPTGHAMRLLEMPALVQNWTQALMRILLKYQPVTGVGALGEALLRLSRGMGRLRAILQDRSAAEFIVVTRAAGLPRAETERLLAGLRRLRVPVSRVIVNAVTAGTCSRCRRIARVEHREIGAIARGRATWCDRDRCAGHSAAATRSRRADAVATSVGASPSDARCKPACWSGLNLAGTCA